MLPARPLFVRGRGLGDPTLRNRLAMSVPPTRPRKHKKGSSSGPGSARLEDSRIFEPFRNLGRVTSGVAPAFYVQASLPYLTTALGRTFQTFDVRCISPRWYFYTKLEA